MSISARLLEERKRLKMSQDRMAAAGGVAKRTYCNYEAGLRRPDSDFLHKLSQHGVDVLYVVDGKRRRAFAEAPSAESGGLEPAPGEFIYIPRFSAQAAAGAGAINGADAVIETLAFRRDWVRNALGVAPKDLVLITVRGDSMSPTLDDGDVILIDSAQDKIQDHAIYAFCTSGEEGLRVKRIQRRADGGWIVKSDNPAYDVETLTARQAAGIQVIGRVAWAGGRM